MTEMLSAFRVFGDKRRKPYSRAYSTIYRSSGHTEYKAQAKNFSEHCISSSVLLFHTCSHLSYDLSLLSSALINLHASFITTYTEQQDRTAKYLLPIPAIHQIQLSSSHSQMVSCQES
jgi:hypothetical protein